MGIFHCYVCLPEGTGFLQIYTNIHLDSLEILLKIQQISTQPSDFFSENDPCCFKAEVICEDRGIATLGGGHGLTFCQKGIHC